MLSPRLCRGVFFVAERLRGISFAVPIKTF